MSIARPLPTTRTTTSSYRERARPALSKPGPRLALVAGTRTRTGSARNVGTAELLGGLDGVGRTERAGAEPPAAGVQDHSSAPGSQQVASRHRVREQPE